MKTVYTIAVMSGAEELECEQFTGIFGLAKAHAAARFEALISGGATKAVVKDDVGRTVFNFPRSDLPKPRLR